jgi:hypothetical protein
VGLPLVGCTKIWVGKGKRENEAKISLLDVYFLKQAAAVFIG